MMHGCSDAHGHGNMVGGPCSCGFFHSQNTCFSVIFSHKAYNEGDMYSFASPTSSSVDCTLSLGTPSTRLSCDAEKRRSSSCMSNFCWDLLHSTDSLNQTNHKITRVANHGNPNFGGGESLLGRRCANCDTTSTPLWRNGPKGPKSLCNACGIRFKKEERRASAAAVTNTTGGGAVAVEAQHMLNRTWVHHSPNQKASFLSSAYGNEFRFNVTDRPGLVHNFTL